MSAGQEIGSPIRENRTLLPAPLPPDEAPGTLAAAAGGSTVGLRPPFDTPAAAFSSRLSRHSHLDCRAREQEEEEIKIVPDAIEFVRWAAQYYRLALATSATPRNRTTTLDRLGIADLFE